MDTAASRAGFGPYRLVSLIARSERASVYRAIDTRHGDRAVALKIFAPALSGDPAFRARFRQDAAALTAVRDPHLVPIHTFGEHAGAVFLDMRFVEAPTLAEIRATRGLPAERSAAVATQIDRGLAAVAASALGQRSVEPAEVLVTGRDGAEFVQLVGLGLGRVPTGAAPPPLPTPPRRRRWVLVASLTAAIALAVTIAVPWRGGRTAPPPGALAVLDDSDDLVTAIAVQADDRSFLSGVSFTGELRTWDLATGATAGPAIEDSGYAPAGAVRDGAPMVLTRDSAQVVHSYRLPDGREATPPTGPAAPALSGTQREEIRAVVPAELDGRPVAVLPDPADPDPKDAFGGRGLGYQVRRLDDGSTVGPLVGFPNLDLRLAPAVAVIDGRPAVITVFEPPTVSLVGEQPPQRSLRVLDMTTGAEVTPALLLPVEVVALATATRAGTPVALLAGGDNSVRIVDLRTGVVGPVLTGMRTPVAGLATVPSAGRTLIVGATRRPAQAGGAEIRCWDLETGDPVGPVMRGPVADGYLTAGTVGDRAVIAATEDNGTDGGRVVVRELDRLLGGS